MSNFPSLGMQSMDKTSRFISAKRYMPLVFDGIHGFLNPMSYNLRKYLPKFDGKHENLSSHHVQLFSDLIGDFEISHEDIHMKLFVQNLEDDARD